MGFVGIKFVFIPEYLLLNVLKYVIFILIS